MLYEIKYLLAFRVHLWVYLQKSPKQIYVYTWINGVYYNISNVSPNYFVCLVCMLYCHFSVTKDWSTGGLYLTHGTHILHKQEEPVITAVFGKSKLITVRTHSYLLRFCQDRLVPCGGMPGVIEQLECQQA